MADEDIFAGMKKKGKKKVTLGEVDTSEPAAPAPVEAVSTPPAPPTAADAEEVVAPEQIAPAPVNGDVPADDPASLFSDMKKKKKKKAMPMEDLPTSTAEATPSATVEVPLKKKKKKAKAAFDVKELDELDGGGEPAADGHDADDKEDEEDGHADAANGAADVDPWVKQGRRATYPELVSRFFRLLHEHNPELAGDKRRFLMVPPQVTREGAKKTMFANINEVCQRMHRQPEHVVQFLYSELGTSGSMDGAQRLIMKGKFSQKQVETVLRHYIKNYVTCNICKSSDTLLERDNRLSFIVCQTCASKYSVQAIKAGYQAQMKRIKA